MHTLFQTKRTIVWLNLRELTNICNFECEANLQKICAVKSAKSAQTGINQNDKNENEPMAR